MRVKKCWIICIKHIRKNQDEKLIAGWSSILINNELDFHPRKYPNEIRSHTLFDIHEIFCLSHVSVIVFLRRNGLKSLLGISKYNMALLE